MSKYFRFVRLLRAPTRRRDGLSHGSVREQFQPKAHPGGTDHAFKVSD